MVNVQCAKPCSTASIGMDVSWKCVRTVTRVSPVPVSEAVSAVHLAVCAEWDEEDSGVEALVGAVGLVVHLEGIMEALEEAETSTRISTLTIRGLMVPPREVLLAMVLEAMVVSRRDLGCGEGRLEVMRLMRRLGRIMWSLNRVSRLWFAMCVVSILDSGATVLMRPSDV